MLQQFPGLPPGPSLGVVSIHFTKNMRKNIKFGLFMACRVFHRCSDIAFPVKRNYSNINLPLSDIASGKVDDNTHKFPKSNTQLYELLAFLLALPWVACQFVTQENANSMMLRGFPGLSTFLLALPRAPSQSITKKNATNIIVFLLALPWIP